MGKVVKQFILLACVGAAVAVAWGCDETDGNSDDGDSGVDVLTGDVADGDASDSGFVDPGAGDALDSDSSVDAGPRSCNDEQDCEQGMYCFAPDESNSGICMEPEPACSIDEDCAGFAPATVCDYLPRQPNMCSYGMMCVIPCNQEGGYECDPIAQKCDTATGKCVRKVCSDSSECPVHHECPEGVVQPVCVRITCAADMDCDAGWCVKGRCFETPGTCEYMAP